MAAPRPLSCLSKSVEEYSPSHHLGVDFLTSLDEFSRLPEHVDIREEVLTLCNTEYKTKQAALYALQTLGDHLESSLKTRGWSQEEIPSNVLVRVIFRKLSNLTMEVDGPEDSRDQPAQALLPAAAPAASLQPLDLFIADVERAGDDITELQSLAQRIFPDGLPNELGSALLEARYDLFTKLYSIPYEDPVAPVPAPALASDPMSMQSRKRGPSESTESLDSRPAKRGRADEGLLKAMNASLARSIRKQSTRPVPLFDKMASHNVDCIFDQIYLGTEEAYVVLCIPAAALRNPYTGKPEEKRNYDNCISLFNSGKDDLFPPRVKQYIECTILKSPLGWPVLRKEFNTLFGLIDEAREKGESVLVQCSGGDSRSAALLTAYLMNRCRVSFSEATNFIRSRRPAVYEVKDCRFRAELEAYGRELGL